MKKDEELMPLSYEDTVKSTQKCVESVSAFLHMVLTPDAMHEVKR